MKYSTFVLAGVVLFTAVCVTSAQWRFAPARRMPAAVQDVKEAVETVKENAAAAADVKTAVKDEIKKVVKAEEAAPAETPAETKPEAKPEPAFPGTNDQWKDSLDADWVAKEAAAHKVPEHFNNRSVLRGDQREGHAYGRYTEADLRLWEAETTRLVMEGSRIFHSAELLGSTNGVSCDMCHPDGEGTHAETYPKYQVQLGRAALLRDMMNWCLQNPCRAEPMSGDDPRMRAMEAYIQATASGKPMKYGKH